MYVNLFKTFNENYFNFGSTAIYDELIFDFTDLS